MHHDRFFPAALWSISTLPGRRSPKMGRVREDERDNMSPSALGVSTASSTSTTPPLTFLLTADRSLVAGTAVILAAGGGHNTLNLPNDGYNLQTDAVNDSLQAIHPVRAYAREWNLEPHEIGIVGFQPERSQRPSPLSGLRRSTD
jgi:hypothetical protein